MKEESWGSTAVVELGGNSGMGKLGRIEGSVHGIVLAGTHSWGGCSLEKYSSRTLLPVGSRPLLWHILRWFEGVGVSDATICCNDPGADVRDRLRDFDSLGVSVSCAIDRMPRGPAGSARDAMGKSDADTFLVVDGTIFPQLDLASVLTSHWKSDAALTLVASDSCSMNGPGREPCGVYVFSRTALEMVPQTGYQDIKEGLIPKLHGAGMRVATYGVAAGDVHRVSDSASYLGVNMWAVEQMLLTGEVPTEYRKENESWIHNTANVDQSARIVGPVVIGPGSRVESNALLVGPSTIGKDCTIRSESVVSRSAVWDGAIVGDGAIVDSSIVVSGAEVEQELVVRESVYVPSNVRSAGFFERLAAKMRS